LPQRFIKLERILKAPAETPAISTARRNGAKE
jgi:hypothetical protein